MNELTTRHSACAGLAPCEPLMAVSNLETAYLTAQVRESQCSPEFAQSPGSQGSAINKEIKARCSMGPCDGAVL